jgi:CHAT domain-containing protein
MNEEFLGENPLLLSGLFLAGANLHGKGADELGTEDGILTAYEVSAMDLTGTEMVVLSACETALGRVEEGEGVYGLRRAFQVAGARTVISALWPVSDQATAEFMAELYANSEESIPERIRRLQLRKIKELRSAGQSDHPFYWAAFIATGGW